MVISIFSTSIDDYLTNHEKEYMGCDIHMYTEISKDNRWVQIDPLSCPLETIEKRDEFLINKQVDYIIPNDPDKQAPRDTYPTLDVEWNKQIYNGRNYSLFGLLAGVRSWDEPLISPRGLPDDMSDSLREIADFSYEHTGHWYTLRELLKIKPTSETKRVLSRSLSTSLINKLKTRAKKYKVPYNKIRIVFWFDS